MSRIWSGIKRIRSANKHVIIYRKHSDDWISALHQDALVWRKLSDIKSIKIISSATELPKNSNRLAANTIIIPLMETHLYEMPKNFISLTSSSKLVKLMADKQKFVENLSGNGFAKYVPKTWTNPVGSTFPCMIKRPELKGGQGI